MLRWTPRRLVSLAGTVVAALIALAGAAPASADHEIDRAVGPGWEHSRFAGSTIEITQTAPGQFAARLSASPLTQCFPTGTLLYEFSGHEPEYTGVEYLALTDEDGECTGAYDTQPADFTVAWDSDRLLFGVDSETSSTQWRKDREDEDEDGLFDDEERSGINIPDDPETEVDLRRMGADPKRKDVFVEIDQMSGHEISPRAVTFLARVFENAPVSNPEGGNGISLHLDAGPSTVMNIETGATWGELSRAETLPHDPVLGTLRSGDNYDWSEFDAIKEGGFEDERSLAFHYGIAAHDHPAGDVGGESRGQPGSDFMVALQCFGVSTECHSGFGEQAAATLHELGHNFGLGHGGADDVNFKPNHFSVMNYSFSTGISMASGGPTIDLSQYDSVPELSESALNERRGVRAPAGASRVVTQYRCTDTDRIREVRVDRPADFDCDGRERGTVAGDVNDDGSRGTLTSGNEWAGLVYDGGLLASRRRARAPRRGLPLPAVTPSLETKDYYESRGIVLGDTKRPKLRLRRKRAGGQVKLRFAARDKKALERLIVSLGAPVDRYVEREPKKGKRKRGRIAYRVKVPKGTRVGAVALDRAGNAAERRFTAR